MSNEYKDWRADRIKEEKQIIEKYPFLRARDINGIMDAEVEFPMINLEIPNGWYKLFYQMCDDIKPLVSGNFYFLQVKEKYNELVCYSNSSDFEVEEILQKYRYISRYVCTKCGAPAEFETKNYIASYCVECWKDYVRHEDVDDIEFINTYEVVGFKNGKSYSRTVNVEDEWNRYLKENGYDAL